MAPEGRGGTPRRLDRRGWLWGGVWGIPTRGSTRWEKSDVPSAGEGSPLSCAVLLPQGPRPGGIPPPRARGCGGETPRPPRSPAPPPRAPCSIQSAACQPSGPASSSQARPSPRPAMRGNYAGGSRTQAGGKAHGECLGVSPNAAGRGKGGGNELHRPGEPLGFPTWGRPLDVREAKGKPWEPSRVSILQGRVTQSAHIGYHDNTTASSCHGSCLSNPIGLLSLPPWAPPHSLLQSPRLRGEGPQKRRGGGSIVSF